MRKYIRSNCWTYNLYARIRTGKRLRLSDEDTDLAIEGFPRSGNTFSRYLFEAAFPNANLASHVHAIAALKAAMRYKKPIILLLRDPMECIASWASKNYAQHQEKIESFVKQSVSDYLGINSFAMSSSEAIHVVGFDDLIARPEEFIMLCARLMNKPAPPGLVGVPEKVKKLMQDREQDKDPLGSSLPSISREIHKSEMAELVERIPAYSKAVKVFHALEKRKERL